MTYVLSTNSQQRTIGVAVRPVETPTYPYQPASHVTSGTISTARLGETATVGNPMAAKAARAKKR
jgi:hypothetical protein